MTEANHYDVIIVGGSYAGLSAAMALGRSLRKVLIIDGGMPCNRQTPHSHNFITQDGKTPKEISLLAREEVLRYPTVKLINDTALSGRKLDKGFEIVVQSGEAFSSDKLIFATGIKDIMPGIPGFSESWGITAVHCPYCHGYEIKEQPTAILANGGIAFDYAKVIFNLTKDLTILTNGPSVFTVEQIEILKSRGIRINETEIDRLQHTDGNIQKIIFKDGNQLEIKAIYHKPAFEQHSDIPVALGCGVTEHGYIITDEMQKTWVPGVFACGDNTSMMRSVANAVNTGQMAGAVANKELVDERF
ncbi:NAD(P)/FAD-dependent oxidoreductase [Taibaiella soli]|uniref:NAD(P)/FAD-dependent oxidoreductase n=1 Tax=Taibaiella soli TaxID=1649169 RepID=A0A2W2AUZ9_9BACT|nr:NAD(P)/FAD-dependent oxidoreductase [Taibaiella soli]PZF71784.1 NAD(P)/FAD-dependent oxidoreductase [Taibaiella soli]